MIFLSEKEQIGIIWIILIILCCISGAAFAQNVPVYQTGKTTRGHPSVWMAPGVQGDAGGPENGVLTGVGVTNTGLPTCINDAQTSSPQGYHQLCLGANATVGTSGPPAGGGGGSVVGPASSRIGDCAIFANTVGTLLADGGCTPAGYYSVSAPPFNAVCDGVTDDTAAITNAASTAALAGGGILWFPARPCFSASGILIPPNVGVQMATFFPGNPPTGAALECPNTISVCLTFTGGTTTLGTTQAQNVVVVGTGTPVFGQTTGIQWTQGYNITAVNVDAYNFDTCMKWKSIGAGGIAFHGWNINSGECQSHYYVFDGWPEAQITSGRAGLDGLGDFSTTQDFVLFTNTSCPGGGCGPNGVTFLNYQFNPGAAGPACAFNWAGFTGKTPSNTVGGEVRFDNDHIEWHTGGSRGVFCSDGTVPVISNLFFTHNVVVAASGTGGTPFFALNGLTALAQSHFEDGNYGCHDMTLAPTPSGGQSAFQWVWFSRNFGCSPVSFTSNSAGNNFLWSTDNVYGQLTVAGGWNTLVSDNDEYGSGFLSDTASGNVDWSNVIPNTWTPVVLINGVAVPTGDYASRGAQVWRNMNGGFQGTFTFQLNAVPSGTSSDVVNITGIPYTCVSGFGGSVPNAAAGLSLSAGSALSIGLANTVPASINLGVTVTGGISTLQRGNLTSSTAISGTFSCAQTQ